VREKRVHKREKAVLAVKKSQQMVALQRIRGRINTMMNKALNKGLTDRLRTNVRCDKFKKHSSFKYCSSGSMSNL
jgi:hypothetical protein